MAKNKFPKNEAERIKFMIKLAERAKKTSYGDPYWDMNIARLKERLKKELKRG